MLGLLPLKLFLSDIYNPLKRRWTTITGRGARWMTDSYDNHDNAGTTLFFLSLSFYCVVVSKLLSILPPIDLLSHYQDDYSCDSFITYFLILIIYTHLHRSFFFFSSHFQQNIRTCRLSTLSYKFLTSNTYIHVPMPHATIRSVLCKRLSKMTYEGMNSFIFQVLSWLEDFTSSNSVTLIMWVPKQFERVLNALQSPLSFRSILQTCFWLAGRGCSRSHPTTFSNLWFNGACATILSGSWFIPRGPEEVRSIWITYLDATRANSFHFTS